MANDTALSGRGPRLANSTVEAQRALLPGHVRSAPSVHSVEFDHDADDTLSEAADLAVVSIPKLSLALVWLPIAGVVTTMYAASMVCVSPCLIEHLLRSVGRQWRVSGPRYLAQGDSVGGLHEPTCRARRCFSAGGCAKYNFIGDHSTLAGTSY